MNPSIAARRPGRHCVAERVLSGQVSRLIGGTSAPDPLKPNSLQRHDRRLSGVAQPFANYPRTSAHRPKAMKGFRFTPSTVPISSGHRHVWIARTAALGMSAGPGPTRNNPPDRLRLLIRPTISLILDGFLVIILAWKKTMPESSTQPSSTKDAGRLSEHTNEAGRERRLLLRLG